MIDSRFHSSQRISRDMMPPSHNHQDNNSQRHNRTQSGKALSPVHFGQNQRNEIQRSSARVSEGRRLRKFLVLTKLLIQRRHDLRHIELQQRRTGPDKSPNVNRRGEYLEVPFLKGSNM